MTTRSLPIDNKTIVNINQIIVPARKEFMTIDELAEQIPLGRTKIYDYIKSGEFIEEKHYTRVGRTMLFYFPEIIAYFKPKRAEV